MVLAVTVIGNHRLDRSAWPVFASGGIPGNERE